MDAYFNQGHVLFSLRRYKEAEQSYRESARLNPSFPAAYSMCAACLINLGQLRRAKLDAEESLRISPEHAFGHYILSIVYSHYGKHKKAESLLREAIRIEQDPEFFTTLARTMLNRGRPNDCVAEVQNALAIDPMYRSALLLLSHVQRLLGEPHLSNETLRAALAHHPVDAEAHRELGRVLMASGDFSNAGDILLEARRLDPIGNNDVPSIARCYGSRLWILSLVQPFVPRWHQWARRRRWATFHLIAAFFVGLQLLSSHDFGYSHLGWITGGCVTTALLAPFLFDLFATLWGQSARRRELQLSIVVHLTALIGTLFLAGIAFLLLLLATIPAFTAGILWFATMWPFWYGMYRTWFTRNPATVHYVFFTPWVFLLVLGTAVLLVEKTVYMVPFVALVLILSYFAEAISWKFEGRGSDYVIARIR